MDREELLRLAQREIARHGWDYFVDEPPLMRDGGKGAVVPGCPLCRVRLMTMNQFMRHLADDVLPGIVDLLLGGGREPGME